MNAYADSSLLVSLYFPDQHTQEAVSRLASGAVLWMTPLHLAECMHAFEQQVFRATSTRSQADSALRLFQEHRKQKMWKEVALPDQAFEVCQRLAQGHTATLGTRTLDTLHVACALELNATHFWTFDLRQEKLAEAVGLDTKNLPTPPIYT